MRLNTVGLISVLMTASACGEDETPANSFPVTLHTLTTTPGCFAEPPSNGANMAEQSALFSVKNARLNVDYAIAAAAYLLAPVLDDPKASEWQTDHADGTRLEGAVIARGDGWGSLMMTALPQNPDHQTPSAFVQWDPAVTEIDSSHYTVSVANRYIRVDFGHGWLVLGCEAATGVSFWSGDAGKVCWTQAGQFYDPTNEGSMSDAAAGQCNMVYGRVYR